VRRVGNIDEGKVLKNAKIPGKKELRKTILKK